VFPRSIVGEKSRLHSKPVNERNGLLAEINQDRPALSAFFGLWCLQF
jgi:hypothetical protein